jgi:hypothetical protein
MDADQQDGAGQEGQRGTGDVYRREADDVDQRSETTGP